ncbi:MAG: hypothetical protein V4515_14485 [Chloroflexota bacterium]
MKIFGREPTLIIGFIAAVVAALVALNFEWLTPGAGAAIVALVGGAVTAATTRPWAPGLFAGLVAAGGALLAEYGLHLSGELLASLAFLVVAGFALFGVRGQVTPVNNRAPISPRDGLIR